MERKGDRTWKWKGMWQGNERECDRKIITRESWKKIQKCRSLNHTRTTSHLLPHYSWALTLSCFRHTNAVDAELKHEDIMIASGKTRRRCAMIPWIRLHCNRRFCVLREPYSITSKDPWITERIEQFSPCKIFSSSKVVYDCLFSAATLCGNKELNLITLVSGIKRCNEMI